MGSKWCWICSYSQRQNPRLLEESWKDLRHLQGRQYHSNGNDFFVDGFICRVKWNHVFGALSIDDTIDETLHSDWFWGHDAANGCTITYLRVSYESLSLLFPSFNMSTLEPNHTVPDRRSTQTVQAAELISPLQESLFLCMPWDSIINFLSKDQNVPAE